VIPVLGVPTLIRYDLLQRMLETIDEPVGQIVLVDNGGSCPEPVGTWVIHLPSNLGVAAAWNLVIKATPHAPWWLLVNDDVTFGPGDLASLAEAMTDLAPQLVTLSGFAAFALNRGAVERVGFFDENFHPAYDEDCDYEYRCTLAEVPIVKLPSHVQHERSATVRDPRLESYNGRTHPENTAYFRRKWGGAQRGGEVYRTPFDQGGSVAEWCLSIDRLDDLAWETTALEPIGETR